MRSDAESRLAKAGNTDGLFLVRKSAKDVVLSFVVNNEVFHIAIKHDTATGTWLFNHQPCPWATSISEIISVMMTRRECQMPVVLSRFVPNPDAPPVKSLKRNGPSGGSLSGPMSVFDKPSSSLRTFVLDGLAEQRNFDDDIHGFDNDDEIISLHDEPVMEIHTLGDGAYSSLQRPRAPSTSNSLADGNYDHINKSKAPTAAHEEAYDHLGAQASHVSGGVMYAQVSFADRADDDPYTQIGRDIGKPIKRPQAAARSETSYAVLSKSGLSGSVHGEASDL